MTTNCQNNRFEWFEIPEAPSRIRRISKLSLSFRNPRKRKHALVASMISSVWIYALGCVLRVFFFFFFFSIIFLYRRGSSVEFFLLLLGRGRSIDDHKRRFVKSQSSFLSEPRTRKSESPWPGDNNTPRRAEPRRLQKIPREREAIFARDYRHSVKTLVRRKHPQRSRLRPLLPPPPPRLPFR